MLFDLLSRIFHLRCILRKMYGVRELQNSLGRDADQDPSATPQLQHECQREGPHTLIPHWVLKSILLPITCLLTLLQRRSGLDWASPIMAVTPHSASCIPGFLLAWVHSSFLEIFKD